MTTIGITNRKGGSGKTTTSVNLATALATAGSQVLLVDADPQAHSALSLGVSSRVSGQGLYDVLIGAKGVASAVRPTSQPGLFLLSGGKSLLEFESGFARDGRARTVLLDALSELESSIDYVLIDTPPTVRLLTIASIVACSHVIVPMPMHVLAMEGLAEVLRILDRIRSHFGRTIELLGIVPTFFAHNTRLTQAIVCDIRRTLGEQSILQPIRSNVALAEAPGHGQAIFRYAPESNGAADYWTLARQVRQMIDQSLVMEACNGS